MTMTLNPSLKGEKIGTTTLSQPHWRYTWKIKQYSFLCSQAATFDDRQGNGINKKDCPKDKMAPLLGLTELASELGTSSS